MTERTAEFQGCVKVFQRARPEDGLKPPPPRPGRSQFLAAAADVALGFEGTTKLIDRLHKLVGRKGFSNNPAGEIDDVMRLFEGDMAGLQRDIEALQRYVDGSSRGSPPPNSQRHKHSTLIVSALRHTAQAHTKAFRDALLRRAAVEKEQNKRRLLFSHSRGVQPSVDVQRDYPLFGGGGGGGGARGPRSPPPGPPLYERPAGQGTPPPHPHQGGQPGAPPHTPAQVATQTGPGSWPGAGNGGGGVGPGGATLSGVWPGGGNAQAGAGPQPAWQTPAAQPPSPSPAGSVSQPAAHALPLPPGVGPPLPRPAANEIGGAGHYSAQSGPSGPGAGFGGMPPVANASGWQPPYPGMSSGQPPSGGSAPSSGGGGGLRGARVAALGCARGPVGRDGNSGADAGPGRAAWQVQDLLAHSQHRTDEAHKVEKMIGELGQMFSHFATLVAEQDQEVLNIEDGVEEAFTHAQAGQLHLARYYQIISGNRSMIIKIFLLLLFFIWLFLGIF